MHFLNLRIPRSETLGVFQLLNDMMKVSTSLKASEILGKFNFKLSFLFTFAKGGERTA